MNDTFDNPLAAGDIVAYSPHKTSQLYRYIITAIGKKKIRIDSFAVKDGIIVTQSESMSASLGRKYDSSSLVYPERVAKKIA